MKNFLKKIGVPAVIIGALAALTSDEGIDFVKAAVKFIGGLTS